VQKAISPKNGEKLPLVPSRIGTSFTLTRFRRYREVLHERRMQASMAWGLFMTKNLQAHPTFATLALLTAGALIALGASSARAYQRCDDIADELKNQVDGLKVGITAGNTIYLSHPQARELSLGCSGRNFKNELYAKADGRKPKPAFLDLVGSAAAIIFSVTKDETLTGATRCINRMGLLRGDTVKMRYRRLDFECTRTKTEASIAISRGTDE
jgi:hypothetical protein